MEKRLELLDPFELLANRINLRFLVAATHLIGHKERVLVKKREVGTNKSIETPSLAGTGMAIREIREVEREATNLLNGGDFAAKNTVDKHKGFQGNDPASRAVNPRGKGMNKRLDIGGRGADPFVDTVSIAVVNR